MQVPGAGLLRLMGKGSKTRGLPPGTLVYVGEKRATPPRIERFEYGPDAIREEILHSMADALCCTQGLDVTWLNLDGLEDTGNVAAAGEHYGLHPLTQEDVLNTAHRPKFDDMEDYLFLCLKMFEYDEEQKLLLPEQINLVLGRGWVLSFQQSAGDVLDPVRQRLRLGRGRIRRQGADYLFYALLDAVVDHYLVVLETLGEEIVALQERVIEDPDQDALRPIQELRRKVLFLRKWLWPLRDALNKLERSDSPLIRQETLPFLSDVQDHVVHAMDVVDTFGDMLATVYDSYVSALSMRMNSVMQVLTVVAAIFIPLTFLAGIYGMNFQHMPELTWRWGYFVLLGIMAAVALGLLALFKRKKWL